MNHPDPFGNGPFEMETAEGGFILTSQIENSRGDKVALRIGPAD